MLVCRAIQQVPIGRAECADVSISFDLTGARSRTPSAVRRRAGGYRAACRGEFAVALKADQSPATIPDREVEVAIREPIETAPPDHCIFGEEDWARGTARPTRCAGRCSTGSRSGPAAGWRSGPAGWSGRSALLEAVLLVTVDNLGAGLAGDYEIQADRSPSSKRATKRKAFFHHRTRLRPVARCHRWSTRIIRMWEPGDRIILFGFSRSTCTLCCFAAVLGQCCRRGWLTLLAAPARRRNDHPHRTRKRSRRFRQPYGSDAAGMDAVPRQMAAAICASLHTELGWFLTHPCVADSVERRQNRWRVSSQRRNLRELVLAVRT
jgi:hypothetical protein